jgi:hypothetical protein
MKLTSSDWINIIGWFASFILGTISATLVQNYFKQRKILSWSVIGESNIITDQAFSSFNVPVKIFIDNQEESSISIVKIRIRNIGNAEIDKVNIQMNFGNNANIYGSEFSGKLGVYRNHLSLTQSVNLANIDIDYINPKQYFDIDFYVGKYVLGKVEADMAKPGVQLKKSLMLNEELLNDMLLSSLPFPINYILIALKNR